MAFARVSTTTPVAFHEALWLKPDEPLAPSLLQLGDPRPHSGMAAKGTRIRGLRQVEELHLLVKKGDPGLEIASVEGTYPS